MNTREEFICEYYVDSKKKRMWAVQLELLKEISRVCTKYSIKYYAMWGTLLGCVRHHGFIPWDDDVDIAMEREDFEKFCSIPPSEFGSNFFLQTALTDRKYFIGYARLRASNTTGIIKENYSVDYNNGIYVDIHPLDGVAPSFVKQFIQGIAKAYYQWLACSYYGNMSPDGIKGILYKCLHYLSRFNEYENIIENYKYWCMKYNMVAKKVGLVYHTSMWKKYQFDRVCLIGIEYMYFEDIMLPVPNGYDRILKAVYGEYMEYPPIEDRGKWHGDALIINPDISYIEYINIANGDK